MPQEEIEQEQEKSNKEEVKPASSTYAYEDHLNEIPQTTTAVSTTTNSREVKGKYRV